MVAFSDVFKQQLQAVGWAQKYDVYHSFFESIRYVTEVEHPAISVVIISWRLHPNTLLSMMELQKQKLGQVELIFVDNGGAAGEFDPLEPYIDTYIRLNQNTGAYVARNIGSIFAKAPILLFLEDDGVPDSQIIHNFLLLFRRYDVISVRGAYWDFTDRPFNDLQKYFHHGMNTFPLPSDLEGNAAYQADVFFAVNGWDDQINFGHGGKELALRLLEVEPDHRKQIQSPICLILHDFVSDEQHLRNKLKKQEDSLRRLLGVNPKFLEQLTEWHAFYNREDSLIVRDATADLSEAVSDLLSRYPQFAEEWQHPKYRAYDAVNMIQLKAAVGSRPVTLFGSGKLCTDALPHLRRFQFEIKQIVDNAASKWGQSLEGLPINNPAHLSPEEDFVILVSSYHHEISAQLMEAGFAPHRQFEVILY